MHMGRTAVRPYGLGIEALLGVLRGRRQRRERRLDRRYPQACPGLQEVETRCRGSRCCRIMATASGRIPNRSAPSDRETVTSNSRRAQARASNISIWSTLARANRSYPCRIRSRHPAPA